MQMRWYGSLDKSFLPHYISKVSSLHWKDQKIEMGPMWAAPLPIERCSPITLLQGHVLYLCPKKIFPPCCSPFLIEALRTRNWQRSSIWMSFSPWLLLNVQWSIKLCSDFDLVPPSYLPAAGYTLKSTNPPQQKGALLSRIEKYGCCRRIPQGSP